MPVNGEAAMHIRPDIVEYFRKLLRIPDEPFEEIEFPPLAPVRDATPFAWLTDSMRTFGPDPRSLLPPHFAAYARIPGNPEHEGCLSREHVAVLATILNDATSSPDLCYYAVWEGYGEPMMIRLLEPGAVPPPPGKPRRRRFHDPPLVLPARQYRVFSGALSAATTSMSLSELSHQSPNLWWPADHAWCVASEIDLDETFVGGSRNCIDRILADPRLRATEVR
jgi:hypothetical protein